MLPFLRIHSKLTNLVSTLQVTLIPGDGIGKEITDSVKEIFEHVNAPIEWEQFDVSGESNEGEALFNQAMDSLRRNRVGLKGELLGTDIWTISDYIPIYQVSFTRLSKATSPGTSPCVSNWTSTPLSFSASPFLVSQLAITTSTL